MKKVVLLSGKIGSGKNTFAELLRKYLGTLATEDSFARPLKEMCAEAFRPLCEYLNSLDEVPDKISRSSFFEQKTPVTRHLLQIVGTEIVRKVDPTYWIRKAIDNINSHPEPIVLITDWRFPDEYHGLDSHFLIDTVRINRPILRKEQFNQHVSETALDHFKVFRWEIENTNLDALDSVAFEMANELREEQLP